MAGFLVGQWQERQLFVKVLEGLSGGIKPGTVVPLAELGLPAKGTSGLLLVFWKAT